MFEETPQKGLAACFYECASPLLAFAQDSSRESGALSQQDNSLVSCLQTFEDQSLKLLPKQAYPELQLLGMAIAPNYPAGGAGNGDPVSGFV